MQMLQITQDDFFKQFSLPAVNLHTPFMITQQGETVGYYIPVHFLPKPEQLEKLIQQGQLVDQLLAQAQVSEDEIVAEFRRLRAHGK